MSVLGAVLAGGASSRFGSDKALAVLAGRSLLDHARAALAGVVDEVAVVGRDDIADLPRAGLGPLGGIAGALDHARRRGFDSVMTIACDMIGVPDGLIDTLLRRAPSYCTDAPVLGHWPTALAAALIRRLSAAPSPRVRPGAQGPPRARADGRAAPWMPGRPRHDGEKGDARDFTLSVRRWAIDIGAAAVTSPAPIANINTPADLAAL